MAQRSPLPHVLHLCGRNFAGIEKGHGRKLSLKHNDVLLVEQRQTAWYAGGIPSPVRSRPKAPGTARPLASTWGRATTSRLPLPPVPAGVAGAAWPSSRAFSAAAAPRFPPPLGSVGSPAKPAQQVDVFFYATKGKIAYLLVTTVVIS